MGVEVTVNKNTQHGWEEYEFSSKNIFGADIQKFGPSMIHDAFQRKGLFFQNSADYYVSGLEYFK